jgi:poly-gamma-glutamate synthase PgsB/CapB
MINRRGRASIVEQVKVLRRGARLGVGAIVAELMSIQPEMSHVESSRILRPQVLVITNVRLDHLEELGRTKQEIAASLASAIPPQATVFIPEAEFFPEIECAADRVKAKTIRVPHGQGQNGPPGRAPLPLAAFSEHIELALAVAAHLGIPAEAARRGLAEARPDFGGLKAWEALLGDPTAPWLLVSAFAANEPESTGLIIDRIKKSPAAGGRPLYGLLILRPDRGDRTRQWVDALDNGFFSEFDKVYLAGAHLRALEIRKRRNMFRFLDTLPGRSPRFIMGRLAAEGREGAVLVGMGNMVGLGADLVEHWERIGRPHAL